MKYLVWLLLGISIALNIWQWQREEPQLQEKSRIDTIRDTFPMPYKVTEYMPMKRKLKVVNRIDTIRDSVEVEVPVVQKEYRDSTYHIWISGYEPRIDSLELHIPTKIEYRHKRWGIGVQTGIGYNGKIAPYIGVGISYNLYSF